MYSAQITRKQKAAIIILIDQSGSMQEEINFHCNRMTKAEAAAYFSNLFIEELVNRSKRDDGINDYFDIMVLCYHTKEVHSVLSDKIEFTPISKLCRMPVEQEIRHLIRKMPNTGNYITSAITHKCWVKPYAGGDTPMFTALMQCEKLATKWCTNSEHRNSFPLMILNITDGDASDCDDTMLSNIAERIKSTSTEDGNTLLFNLHLASSENTDITLKFPSSYERLPDNKLTKLLYEISSSLPDCYNDVISEIKGVNTQPPYRAMCYNCSAEELIKLLSIGSVSIDRTI